MFSQISAEQYKPSDHVGKNYGPTTQTKVVSNELPRSKLRGINSL